MRSITSPKWLLDMFCTLQFSQIPASISFDQHVLHVFSETSHLKHHANCSSFKMMKIYPLSNPPYTLKLQGFYDALYTVAVLSAHWHNGNIVAYWQKVSRFNSWHCRIFLWWAIIPSHVWTKTTAGVLDDLLHVIPQRTIVPWCIRTRTRVGGHDMLSTRHPLTDWMIFHQCLQTNGRETSSRTPGCSVDWISVGWEIDNFETYFHPNGTFPNMSYLSKLYLLNLLCKSYKSLIVILSHTHADGIVRADIGDTVTYGIKIRPFIP